MTTFTFRADGLADEYLDGCYVSSWVVSDLRSVGTRLFMTLCRPPECQFAEVSHRQKQWAHRARYAATSRPDWRKCRALAMKHYHDFIPSDFPVQLLGAIGK
jgi:hypothetical protein